MTRVWVSMLYFDWPTYKVEQREDGRWDVYSTVDGVQDWEYIDTCTDRVRHIAETNLIAEGYELSE